MSWYRGFACNCKPRASSGSGAVHYDKLPNFLEIWLIVKLSGQALLAYRSPALYLAKQRVQFELR